MSITTATIAVPPTQPEALAFAMSARPLGRRESVGKGDAVDLHASRDLVVGGGSLGGHACGRDPCVRKPGDGVQCIHPRRRVRDRHAARRERDRIPVSYTHLTLPTIY